MTLVMPRTIESSTMSFTLVRYQFRTQMQTYKLFGKTQKGDSNLVIDTRVPDSHNNNDLALVLCLNSPIHGSRLCKWLHWA